MNRWTCHSFLAFSKVYVLCFFSACALALTFDIAAESDKWINVGTKAIVFRGLSIGLYLAPISLWLALLVTLMRWQLTHELKILENYVVSAFEACKGIGLSMFLIVLCWFVMKEGLWITLLDRNLVQTKTVLFQLEEGTVLIDKVDKENGYSSVWFEIGETDVIFPHLQYLNGAWQLKENIRFRDDKLKKKLEEVLYKKFPLESHLEHHFIPRSSLSLLELGQLKPEGSGWMYRLGLPVLSFFYMFLVSMKLIYLKKYDIWKWWSVAFLSFIMVISFLESSFN